MRAARILLACALAMPLPAAAQSLAIVHAKAWTLQSDQPVDDATILVTDGKIVSVRGAGPVPAGMPTIDAKGQPVTPGFANAATQLGLTEVSSASDTRDVASNDAGAGASFDIRYALNGNSALVELARGDGLTRALSYPSPSDVPPFSGEAAMIRLREGVDILDRASAAMFVVIGGGTSPLGSRAAQWQRLRDAFDEAKSNGATSSGDDKPLLSRRDAVAVRAVLSGMQPLGIVTHRESDIREAIRLAADYRIKVVIVGGAEAWRAAPALAAAHIPVILDPQANMPASFDQLGARRDNAAILARAGVTIAFGLTGGVINFTYNAGVALREGAGLAVAGGLPYATALRAATVNPITIWGGRGAGTMAPGSDADLVVWDGDPLEPLTQPVAMVIEGRRVSTRTRQDALVERYLERAKP